MRRMQVTKPSTLYYSYVLFVYLANLSTSSNMDIGSTIFLPLLW